MRKRLALALLLLAALPGLVAIGMNVAAVAQEPPPPPEPVAMQIPMETWEALSEYLLDQPYRDVAPIIQMLAATAVPVAEDEQQQ